MEEKLTEIVTELASLNKIVARLETTLPKIESKLQFLDSQITYVHKRTCECFNDDLNVENLANNTDDKKKWFSKHFVVKKDSLLYQLADSVTAIVGLKEALTSKHIYVKYAWAFLFALGLVCTIFFVYKTADEYLDEPTATKILINVSAMNEIPTVALCPAAWMDADKATTLGFSEEAMTYSLGYINTWPNMRFDNVTRAKTEFLDSYYLNNFSSLLDYYKAIAIDLSTVNTTMAYNNISTGVKLGDKHAYLIGKIFIGYQICYAYAFSPTDRSLYTTTSASIKFYDKTNNIVNISPGLWLEALTDINFQCGQIPAIHLPSFTNNKILTSVRRFTTLNNCKKKGDEVDSYSTSSCTADCQNRKYKELIDCRLFKYAFVSKVGSPEVYCNLLEKTKMNNLKFSEFRASDEHTDLTKICLDQCAPTCEKVIYQWSVQWQQILPNDDADKNSSRKLTSVAFSIDHMATFDGETVTMTEVNTYSYTELVNNVGGTLGLFVGATLMTFGQLILFCVERVFVNKRQNSVVENLRQSTF